MIPFENNKVQDSKMMDHSSKTVTSKTGKDLLSALSRLSSITGGRKTSGVSIWMWMILCINIITDNENKKDRMTISYPSIIM